MLMERWTKMETAKVLCPNCGTENRTGAKVCAQCGKDLSQPTLEPLPEGALLNERRYEIVAFLGTRDGINEYRAERTEPYKRCPHCRTLNTPDSNFCEQCGSELAGAEAVSLKVRVREAASADALWRERALYEKGLHHPLIAAPLEIFTDTPYDERHYAVLPEVEGTPLAQVEADDADTALAWAKDLSDAFAHLQMKGVSLAGSLAESVLFADDGTPFIPTDALRPEPGDWTAVRRELGEATRRWLIGVQETALAERVSDLFAQASEWAAIVKGIEALWLQRHAPTPLRLSIASATDVGRRREHNEDSYLTMHFERCHLDQAEALAILAVADGMGGHAAGEVASKLCLQTFAASLLDAIKQWLQSHEPDWAQALKQAAMEANRQVFAEAQQMRNNMGTTLVAALLVGNRAIFANVGDSRGYLLQGGKLRQVTKDHSYVQQLVDAGLLTPEQARHHPQGNIITQAIGIEPTVQVDIFEEPLREGDLVLLCSDGLVDMIDDADIERVLLMETDLRRAVTTLVQLANEAGGDDNITVVLARAERAG
jgi:serine/threonine protein phosphatase PrpC/uncharacterized OB-fold protein